MVTVEHINCICGYLQALGLLKSGAKRFMLVLQDWSSQINMAIGTLLQIETQ